jgi:phage FluMu protein Com
MSGRRSPIEMMIDAACGYDPSKPQKKAAEPDIEMRCPECAEVLMVHRDETDPEGTAKIETACPRCRTADFKISYFDAKGELIESL